MQNHELDLERLILLCLEKRPENRPQTALELGRRFAACSLETRWSEDLAAEWWKSHAVGATHGPGDPSQTDVVAEATIVVS
jgi:hypothetical protein